ncbi:hypothetical protein CL655_03350 [bacterium]|nr:hypothetical protein [bacterium]|tara:strand:- start:18782 stop:19453 length:672 start_codon:yes stop_codon:yes gene_type:complete
MQVLIIPDLFAKDTQWEPVVESFAKAGVRAEVVSFTAPRDEDLSEIVEFVNQRLIEKTYLIGHGVGGRVAIQLASQQPHQLAGLMLTSTPAMPAASFRTFLFKVLHFFGTLVRIVIPYYIRKKIVTKYRELKPGDPKKTLYNIIIAPSMEAFLAKLSVPLLLLWGERDTRVAPAVAEVMSETLHNFDVPHDLQLVAGGTDQLHVSHAELVAHTVLEALQSDLA